VRVGTVSSSVTISRHFDWVDFPPRRFVPRFSPGIDFILLAGCPEEQGAFLGAFPFQRFPTVVSIRERLSVLLICGDTGREILRSVRVEDLRVNPIYAPGCFVATIIEFDQFTGRVIPPPFEQEFFRLPPSFEQEVFRSWRRR